MKAEKWQKVASYQEKRTDQVVRCHLCPHRCVLLHARSPQDACLF
ncbi:MAG: hypothetical protein ACMV17_01225 [Macellibacteroides fermentans]